MNSSPSISEQKPVVDMLAPVQQQHVNLGSLPRQDACYGNPLESKYSYELIQYSSYALPEDKTNKWVYL